jgi:hypothetical protein
LAAAVSVSPGYAGQSLQREKSTSCAFGAGVQSANACPASNHPHNTAHPIQPDFTVTSRSLITFSAAHYPLLYRPFQPNHQ